MIRRTRKRNQIKPTPAPPEWYAANNGMILYSPYSVAFLDDLKLAVPPGARLWVHKTSRWWISDAYLDDVDNLLFTHFGKRGFGRH